uniref:Exonuclease V-like n=1 Tax=Saccoglossus kowalevskii TaxID=10224 RepID=A0ABM0MM68_SACKO|nr:PREDICTED: exonuclease V-like [Saccoglossus kowalevskii]
MAKSSDEPAVKRKKVDNKMENQADLEKVAEIQKKWELPLWKFRRGRLCVTDITSQSWCEQQLLYTYTLPTIPVENKAMVKGSSLHLARELEVHDIVPVKVTSREDSWAIKLLNIMDAINGLSFDRLCIREMPIFGDPFEMGVFMVGIIDELKYNESGELQLLEFKSRSSSKTLPGKAQKLNHALQVMLYKQMFDELVSGKLSREMILGHVNLDEGKVLGSAVLDHMQKTGIHFDKFGELLDAALLQFQFSSLPHVDSLEIEYCFQGDCLSFATDKVQFDSDWLRKKLDHSFLFWRGVREAEGVDIEDAWKCQNCDFVDICEWRKKKQQECMEKNQISINKL